MHDCNISFVGRIEVESHELCGYINYHVFMLIIFVTISIYCAARACFEFACCELRREDAYRSLLWAVIFLILSTGFDGIYLIFLIFFICICLEKPARVCYCALLSLTKHIMDSTKRATTRIVALMRCTAIQRKVAPSNGQALEEIMITDSGSESTTSDTAQEELKLRECPICIDTGGDRNAWFAPKCGHAFHLECIKGWMSHGTCPLCRGPLFF